MSDATHSRERALLDQKEVYRQILDAIADMVLVKGAGSRILWANKAFRDYYGMTNELLYERVDANFNQADYTEQYVRDDHYVFTSGQVLNIPDEPVTRSDGLVQIFHTVKSPLHDDEGRVLMTVGVSRNITESKRIKEDLARYREHLEHMVEVRTDELSRLSDELSTILSSLIEGIVAVDAVGRVQLMNPAARALLGIEQDEAVDKSISELIDFFPEHVDPHAPAASGLAAVLANGRTTTGQLRTRQGELRLVSMQAAPLKGTNEAGSGTVLVLRDIALEREVADQRLRHQKLESLGLLAGGIAHDFNNILTGILANISIASIERARGRAVDDLLEQAQQACLRAQGLTSQLLTFARGGAPVKKTLVVAKPVREAAELTLRGSQLLARAESRVRRRAGLCRRRTTRAGHRQSRDEREAGHAERGAGLDSHRQRRGEHGRAAARTRLVRADRCARSGQRHRAGAPATHLRSILHDEAHRQRTRSGVRPLDSQTARRLRRCQLDAR